MGDVIEVLTTATNTVEVEAAGPQGPAGAAGATGAQGPQGAPGTGLEVLTTQGDLLYQGGATGERLPIGTAGQVLKVVTGEPAWANESGGGDEIADDLFRVIGSADATKKVAFEVDGLTAATTRTLTVPNASGRLQVEGEPIGNTTPAAGTFTTLSANNGTRTASAPVLDLAQTWNASGTTFTGLRANFTNTASAAASRLMDLQLGGTSQFYVERGGTIVGNVANSGTLLTSAVNFVAFDVAAPAGGRIRFAGSGLGAQPLSFWSTLGAYRFGPDGNVASTVTGFWLNTEGTSDVLALRNGTNAQTYRLYNSFTSATSFERLNVRWASNELIIDAEKGSVGGTLRGIKLGSATSSLLGFYGVTPVDQPATVTDPTGVTTDEDVEARTAINAIIDRLQEVGIIA